MGKLWPLFLLLSLACTVLNPYVGFFGLFLLVQLLVCFCLVVNIKQRVRLYPLALAENNTGSQAAMLRRSAGSLVGALRVLSVVFFLLCTFISCAVWLLASGRASAQMPPTDMAPFSLFPQESKQTAGIVLLAAGLGLNLLATASLLTRCKQFAGQIKNPAPTATIPGGRGRLSFTINIPVVSAALAAAIIFGLLNTRVGWLSPLLHLAYLMYIAISKLVVRMYGNMASKNAGTNARHMLSNMERGKPFNRLLQAIAWATAGVVVLVQVLCSFVVPAGVFTVVDTRLDTPMLLLSCASNVVLALSLCLSAGKMRQDQPEEKKSGDD